MLAVSKMQCAALIAVFCANEIELGDANIKGWKKENVLVVKESPFRVGLLSDHNAVHSTSAP